MKTREATHFALSALGLPPARGGRRVGCRRRSSRRWLTRLIARGVRRATDSRRRRASCASLFPMTGLLVLSAWGLGVLNAHRRFFLPYAAPVVVEPRPRSPALVVFGGVARPARRAAGDGARVERARRRRPPAARAAAGGARAARRAAPAPRSRAIPACARPRGASPARSLGRGVIQLSGLIDTRWSSFLGTGAQRDVRTTRRSIYLLPMACWARARPPPRCPTMAERHGRGRLERRNARSAQAPRRVARADHRR